MLPFVAVKKITVDLDDQMKRDLQRLAASSGRSEAQLIRDAVAALIGCAATPRPRGQLFSSGDGASSERVDELVSGFGER